MKFGFASRHLTWGNVLRFRFEAAPLIAMPIRLDHLTILCRDRVASARQPAELLGVPWAEQGAIGTHSPVDINASLTLDFAQCDDAVTNQHCCFQVEREEFDAIPRAHERGKRSLPQPRARSG